MTNEERELEKRRMEEAKKELRFLNLIAPVFGASPIATSVAKAMTMAQCYPDVEAQVVCKDVDEALKVIREIAKLARPGEKVSDTEPALEMSNGSCVKVIVERIAGALKGERKS